MGRSVEKITIFLSSIKRHSIVTEREIPCSNYCIAFTAMRGIAASPYKNRIFMDREISHIQHITRINGIARTRSSAISRRAALSDE